MEYAVTADGVETARGRSTLTKVGEFTDVDTDV
jgi:hypothetical protein